MNLLDLVSGQYLYRKVGNKNGGEHQGACPWCGDGSPRKASDGPPNRFHVWPHQGQKGTYWCRSCGRSGDAIKYLIDHDGLTFKEALARLDLSPDVLGKRERPPIGWQPEQSKRPADIWREHAEKFVVYCHERLLERPDDLIWLAARGISIVAVKKYRLGINPTHEWRERSAWALPPEKRDDGKLKKLWLPRGLVIPRYADDKTILGVRIRQPEGSPRYYVVPGSSREPFISRAADALFVFESELDAIAIDDIAGDLVGSVAMGNDSAKPTTNLMVKLQEALFIGVSLDSDMPKFNENTGRLEMAGPKSARWWLEKFDQAMRIPMVGGNDPGEAFADGLDLRTWILAGLPPYFQVKAELDAAKAKRKEEIRERIRLEKEQNDQKNEQPAVETATISAAPQPLSGDDCPAEGEPTLPQPPVLDEKQVTYQEITAHDGRKFFLVDNQADFMALAGQGHIVFSKNEIERLQKATATMTKEERMAATSKILDMKELFPFGWIKNGLIITQETEEAA